MMTSLRSPDGLLRTRVLPAAVLLASLAATAVQAAPANPAAAHAATVSASASASASSSAPALPREHRQGEVVWMSGGIGLDESQAMQQAARDWPLTIEFARRDGARSDYLADVEVLVRDGRGHEVLGTRAQGPFLMAKLAPGRYTVEAARGDQVLRRDVQIRAGQPARVLMLWPQHEPRAGQERRERG